MYEKFCKTILMAEDAIVAMEATDKLAFEEQVERLLLQASTIMVQLRGRELELAAEWWRDTNERRLFN